MEFPRLVELHSKYGEMGVEFVSIDTAGGGAATDTFVAEHNATHTLLTDTRDIVSRSYRIVAIPVTVMIDHEGRVIYRHLGFADEMVPRLEGEIETLMAWKEASQT